MLLGSGPAVLREGADSSGKPDRRLLTIGGFKDWIRPHRIQVGRKDTAAADFWLNSPDHRKYEGLCFAPGEATPGFYNLWRGWAVEPDSTSSCQLFISHIADNVCQGDGTLFAWVMGWFAAIVQRPAEKMGISLVLRGRQGAGKTIVGRTVGALFGLHYTLVADPRYITGRFNSHLVDCLMLQADEGFWAGDHAAEGKLKDLITGDYHLIEYKGKEPVRVRNHVRLLVTSNARWVVPAGLDERRFAVIDVGDDQAQNHNYFRAIDHQMQNEGGLGALMHYLQEFDFTDVPLRNVPATEALLEQKVQSLPPDAQWWLDILHRGELPDDRAAVGVCPTAALYDSYIESAKNSGATRRSLEVQLATFLREHVPRLERSRGTITPRGPRVYVYSFPKLATCRAVFAERIGHDIAWQNPTTGWGGDAP